VSFRVVDGSSIVALGLLLVAGCARVPETGFVPHESSTGYLEIRVTDVPRAYSFRADPKSEFLKWRVFGGMLIGPASSIVVYSDGRYVEIHRDGQGNVLETSETQLSKREMEYLLRVIVEAGLMDHDSHKARVAERRNPMEGRRFTQCSDCATVSLTIQLAEDNCPGRKPWAPITAQIQANPVGARYNKDISELNAVVTLSRTLDGFRDRARQMKAR